jgi:hypothetical protein
MSVGGQKAKSDSRLANLPIVGVFAGDRRRSRMVATKLCEHLITYIPVGAIKTPW